MANVREQRKLYSNWTKKSRWERAKIWRERRKRGERGNRC